MSRTKQAARRGTGKRKREAEAESLRPAKKQETSRPAQTTYDEAVAMMDPSLMSDHFVKAMKRHASNITALELEDKYIPTRCIRDTTSFSEAHIAKQLPAFLEQFSDGGTKALSQGNTATPHTLVITASGIRAADLARELRVYANDENKVGKLFAKHMKLAESIAFVQKTKINIGVGTPKRPRELIEHGALKVDRLQRIVIDGSYVDEKRRTIFDMSEIFLPLVELLNTSSINKRLGADEDAIEILVF